MKEHIRVFVGDRSPDHARVTFEPVEGSPVAEVSGFVRGPFCAYSKTLTADFPLHAVVRPKVVSDVLESLVMEPCYWTPQLPFWYDLHLKLKLHDGTDREEKFPLGMKRWHCEGRNFRLQLKRIVLRGLRLKSPTENDVRLAHESETALIVDNPTHEVCHAASQLGVPLIVDLRETTLVWGEVFANLDWYPADMLILVSVKQLESGEMEYHWPKQGFVAACVQDEPYEPKIKCDAFAVQLADGARPPAWLAHCNKPVIAIRKNTGSVIATARAGCDRLQAELAPEFDLAGYFV